MVLFVVVSAYLA